MVGIVAVRALARSVVGRCAATFVVSTMFAVPAARCDEVAPDWLLGGYRVFIHGAKVDGHDRTAIVESTGVIVISGRPIEPGQPEYAARFRERYAGRGSVNDRVCAYFEAVDRPTSEAGGTKFVTTDLFPFLTTDVESARGRLHMVVYESPDFVVAIHRIIRTASGFEAVVGGDSSSADAQPRLVAVRDGSISLEHCLARGLEIAMADEALDWQRLQ